MSTSDLYLVYGKSAKWHSEYQNGRGSGPAIWDYLTKRYGIQEGSFLDRDANKALWALARDPKVPAHLRLCHAFTFDQACCPADKLVEMADALDQAHADIMAGGPFTWSHFPAIAASLREIHAGRRDHRMVGAALNCTSVADIWTGWTPERRAAWDCYAYAMAVQPGPAHPPGETP